MLIAVKHKRKDESGNEKKKESRIPIYQSWVNWKQSKANVYPIEKRRRKATPLEMRKILFMENVVRCTIALLKTIKHSVVGKKLTQSELRAMSLIEWTPLAFRIYVAEGRCGCRHKSIKITSKYGYIEENVFHGKNGEKWTYSNTMHRRDANERTRTGTRSERWTLAQQPAHLQ